MTERDRLRSLINVFIDSEEYKEDDIVDYLLANGVIVPPCKVGQTVYVISRYYTGFFELYECTVDSITKYDKNTFLSMSSKGKFTFGEEVSQLGKTVFLTKEEAVKALEGMKCQNKK